jgi:hypothetical protein
MRVVTLVALAGIGTAALCLPISAAIVFGADDGSSWVEKLRHFSRDDGLRRSPKQNAQLVREFPWNGSDRLEIDLPATAHFKRAPTWHLSVRGTQRALDRLRVDGGTVSSKQSSGLAEMFDDDSDSVELDLTGPTLSKVTVNGSGDVVLDDLLQHALTITINGSGSVRATGRVDSFAASISGSGDVAMEKLAARAVSVTIAGSGDADVSPIEQADISVAGSGTVRLHSHPRTLNSHVAGSGEITELPQ